jgi:integrase
MPGSLHEHVRRVEELFDAGSYADNSIQRYRAVWVAFARYCEAGGVGVPTRVDGLAFLKSLGISGEMVLTKQQKHKQRVVEYLFTVADTGALPAPASRNARRPVVPQRFVSQMASWEAHLSGLDLARATLERKRLAAMRVLSFLGEIGVVALCDVQVRHVHQFAASHGALMGSAGLVQVRGFLRFLADRGVVPAAIGAVLPVIGRNREARLASVFTPAEVARGLDSIASWQDSLAHPSRRSLLRRDRAMFMLAAVLGLRGGDIVDLRVGDIDWVGRRLSRRQSKTGRRIDLPIPEEVLLGELDYLKNECPDSDDDHVFLLGRALYGPYRSKATVHVVVADAFKRAGIDVGGRRHGPHALRHSLAVAMLTGGATYPAIGAVLGHSSSEATRTYLRVDVEHLRPLVPEVPDGH